MRPNAREVYEEVQNNVYSSRQTNEHGLERRQISSMCPVHKNWHDVEGLICFFNRACTVLERCQFSGPQICHVHRVHSYHDLGAIRKVHRDYLDIQVCRVDHIGRQCDLGNVLCCIHVEFLQISEFTNEGTSRQTRLYKMSGTTSTEDGSLVVAQSARRIKLVSSERLDPLLRCGRMGSLTIVKIYTTRR
jgi:hypothetical protein